MEDIKESNIAVETECVELKNIKYKTMMMNGHPLKETVMSNDFAGLDKFLEDEKSLRGILAKLTRTHEAKQEKPWKMSDAPSDYIAAELKEIIGIEIEIQHMIGKFKLSQNRDQADAVNVVNNLEKQGQIQLAEAVKQYIED